MPKIKDLDFSVTNITNGLPSITVKTTNLLPDMKIKKALLQFKISEIIAPSSEAVFNVNCSLNNKLIDRISNISVGNIIKINVTNEIQTAIDLKLEQFTLSVTSANSTTTTFSLEKLENNDLYKTNDVEYISKAEYSANGTSHNINLGTAGQASINLNTGILNIVHQDIKSDNNVLPLSVSHIYNSFGTKLPTLEDNSVNTGISNNYGNGWKLNLEQYLVERTNESATTIADNLSSDTNSPSGEYEYIDENGKKQIIVEKYYYITTEENLKNIKNYVNRDDEKLLINLNGEL